ncbi:MAG: transglycosylase domain-containing protein, partial [Armatimonadota bacterium]
MGHRYMSTRTVKQRAHISRKKRHSWLLLTLSIIQTLVLVGLAAASVLVVLAFWNVSSLIPKIGAVAPVPTSESTRIYAANGELLAVVYGEENREYVPLKQIPKHLVDATIAAEDRRFREHSGLDFRGIARALIADIVNRDLSQGGSTITQQLARNLFLTRRKVFTRKVQEAILAIQIERRYTKDEILEMYLNQVFYGCGAYGVQAAARVYFNKPVSELTLPECALLAAIPRRPSYYNPYHDRELAEKRRNLVLTQMAEMGMITSEEARKAKATPIELAFSRPSGARVRRAPYFVDFVLRELAKRYGDENVYSGGLRVYTSLDPAIQAAAEKALRSGVARYARYRISQGALVCLDAKDGDILAMVGGVDYRKSQLNRAYLVNHPRQAGSAFKPFVYAAALEQGMTPSTRILDAPVSYPGGPGGRLWTPHNYGGGHSGWVTMEQAIARSINIPAIRTLDRIGIDKGIEMARRLGITSPIPHNLSIAIGTAGVTVLEMAAAYTAFANGGIVASPRAILRVQDRDGVEIEKIAPNTRRVLSEAVASQMDRMLRAVVEWGTASRAAGHIPEARGKTGTTQNERDAWFVGYTPQLVAAVWLGNDDNTAMRRATGGVVCAPIWADFMQNALRILAARAERARTNSSEDPRRGDEMRDRPSRSFVERTEPAREESASDTSDTVTVAVCDESGELATSACPSTHMRQYARGT